MVNKIDCWSKGVQPIPQRYCLQNLKLWVYTFKTVQRFRSQINEDQGQWGV
jgi:hypothetical protein